MDTDAKLRTDGKELVELIDGETGRAYVTALSYTGRPIEKNRSRGWRGYKSHLTKRQKQIIRWYLRQRDRGIPRWKLWIRLQELDVWISSPMQYPLSSGTLASWELTRAAEAAKGRDWPTI